MGDENGFDSFVEMNEAEEETSSQKDGEFEVSEAMKLINNSGGRRVSAKAHSAPKDAYFSFLLLRHLRIRDLKNKVLSVSQHVGTMAGKCEEVWCNSVCLYVCMYGSH